MQFALRGCRKAQQLREEWASLKLAEGIPIGGEEAKVNLLLLPEGEWQLPEMTVARYS